jgi:hypothetical protein
MTILRFLFYAFLLYLAFKLVFDLVLPVYRTTRKLKKGFREMQQKMNQHQEQYHQQSAPPPQVKETEKSKAGDYIDFEEIK